jgi:hypothetical protein
MHLLGIMTAKACVAGAAIHELCHCPVFKHRNLLWIEWGQIEARARSQRVGRRLA